MDWGNLPMLRKRPLGGFQQAAQMSREEIITQICINDWGGIRHLVENGYAHRALDALHRMTCAEQFTALSYWHSMGALVRWGKGEELMSIVQALPEAHRASLHLLAAGLPEEEGLACDRSVLDLFQARYPCDVRTLLNTFRISNPHA